MPHVLYPRHCYQGDQYAKQVIILVAKRLCIRKHKERKLAKSV